MSNLHSTNNYHAAPAASVSPARVAGQDPSSSIIDSQLSSHKFPLVDPPEDQKHHIVVSSSPSLSPGPPTPPEDDDEHQPGHPPSAAAAAAAAAPAAAVPTPTTLVADTSDHTVTHAARQAADQIKYHRGPAAYLQRHHSGPGASLLTQAFATARGTNHNNPYTPQQQPADNTPTQPRPQVVESHPPSAVPSENHTRQQQQHDNDHRPPPQEHRYEQQPAFQDEEEDNALTPKAGSPRNSNFHKTHTMPSMTATATMTGPPLGGVIELDLRQVNSMLKGHREYLTKNKGRGRSLERTDFTDSADSSHPVVFTKLSESPTALSNHDGAADNGDNAIPRLRKDQRAQTVPEKAWSIGVGELTDDQDGMVEKSITEVLAGVEPNARSRKASHSLRFFKEGLPDEKSKKRDTKKDRLPSTAETAEETETEAEGKSRTTTVPASASEDTQLPEADEPAQARSVALLTPVSPAGDKTAEDYFLAKPVEEPAQVKQQQQPPAAPGREHTIAVQDFGTESGKRSPSLDRKPEPRRKSDASIDGGSHTEDGEESGEEKISSAVFLPHQCPEEAEEHSDVPGAASSRSVLPSRTHSRAEDFHPWLVKAGEPEVECLDECPDIEKTHRLAKPADSAAATVPFVGSQIDTGKVNEPAVADESETGVLAPQSKPSLSIAAHPSPHHLHPEETVHDHQGETKDQPLDAIELIPYKHQVGGHTTLWRFSRRAVCKQLNNRENEFYEKIEQYHRDLLAFLPRYIGVLNVTFQKKPRRRSVHKRDEAAAALEAPAAGQNEASSGAKGTETALTNGAQPAQPEQRIISQSMQQPAGQIPTVTFVDNQHILPRSLIQPALASSSSFTRFRSASASVHGGRTPNGQYHAENPSHMLRPRLEDRHANSWGATMVNKRLRNKVFNDAFLKQPIAVHRHKKGHQRPFSRLSLQPVLRHTESDPNLEVAQDAKPRASSAGEESRLKPSHLVRSEENLATARPRSFREEGVEDDGPQDVTGTSAPEPEILKDASPAQPVKKRRYSGTGLRRKPKDVQDARGDLHYFEEADSAAYKADNEESVFEVDSVDEQDFAAAKESIGPLDTFHNGTNGTNGVNDENAIADDDDDEIHEEIAKIPRPINPKEAQTQTDSRVEYFLLLEDLTAGMKRPCIMDLKMGTRQYGVEASPKKQKSQQGKCAKTTSRELGVRVCGLQVWDVATQSYVFKDKYYGRDLKAGQEFQDALTRFLYDGVDRASILRHIPTVLHKLSELEVIIRRLKGYRFYAASLLMFYDGEPLPPPTPPTPATTTHSEYDTALEDYYSTDFATDNDDATFMASKQRTHNGNAFSHGNGGQRKKRKDKHEIDFKMADFANCVTAEDLRANGIEGKPCPPQFPEEPDNGFLRGLRSLRRYFLRIQRDVRRELGMGTWKKVDEEIEREIMEEYAEDEGYVSN
ncbi:SAICAR synthase-like protein [Copromyces sp. CBS 386.78]|nr:SAICAR synthase-like protein [Copromyces sp. CBS 386.78]